MRRFGTYNPAVLTAYYILVSGILMFSTDPVLLALSFAGSLLSWFLYCRDRSAKRHLYCLYLFFLLTIVNPIFSHNGKTVLFVVNDMPFTLEAILFGATAAGIVVTVLYLFSVFTKLMTRDKLLYVFGLLSPKLSLVLSMSIRFVPLFLEQRRKVRSAQLSCGTLLKDDLVSKIRTEGRVFSILVTWALENGIITADSMSARGYGLRRRTFFNNFTFDRHDLFLLLSSLVLSGCTITAMALHQTGCSFYPSFSFTEMQALTLPGYAAYGILSLLPALIDGKEALLWRSYKRKN